MFKRLREGISRTRQGLLENLRAIAGRSRKLDAQDLETLETSLLLADTGIDAAQAICAGVERRSKESGFEIRQAIRGEIAAILKPCEQPFVVPVGRNTPFVTLVLGVNGAGKTTTIAKIGHLLQKQGHSVMFAAGDTFRAAAIEQLQTWGERLQIPVIAQAPGADPAAVLYDACAAAAARGIDVLLADTAGRLHTHAGLMDELVKIKRVVQKYDPSAPHETILVLDATMGQNALVQARIFNEQIGVDSLILTKLDGTAKGGILLAIARALALPIRYVGVGEQADSLEVFSADEFAAALIDTDQPNEEGAVRDTV
jgi:fused signal recognition particle receptor